MAPKLLANEIAAYSDAELDQYLQEHRLDRVGGGKAHYIDVKDPENLPEEFIQRLRDRVYRASDAAESRPVDLDQVCSRLLEISADREASPQESSRSSSRSATPPTAEELYLEDLRRETESYNALVNDGGRPSHPISRLEDIAKDPGEYSDILRFWQEWPNKRRDEWRVFGNQLWRWQNFRESQKKSREGDHFPRYADAVRRRLEKHGFTRSFQLNEDLERQDEMTTWIEYLDYEYRVYNRYANIVKRQQRLYDDEWKKLVDLNVLRHFETEEVICDIRSAFQHQSERIQAEKAVESAKSALTAAKKAMRDPRRTSLSSQSRQQRLAAAESRLDATTKSLKMIRTRNKLVTDFIQSTMSYREAKEDRERHTILLRWMLHQVPLMELELNQPNTVEHDLGQLDSRRRLKRDLADEFDKDQTVKKRRLNDGMSHSFSDHNAASASQGENPKRHRHDDAAGDERPSKRPRHIGSDSSLSHRRETDTTDEMRESQETTAEMANGKPALIISKRRGGKSSYISNFETPLRENMVSDIHHMSTISRPLRRSARIADREERLRAAAIAPPGNVKTGRPGAGKLAQEPTPPSSIVSGGFDRSNKDNQTRPCKAGY